MGAGKKDFLRPPDMLTDLSEIDTEMFWDIYEASDGALSNYFFQNGELEAGDFDNGRFYYVVFHGISFRDSQCHNGTFRNVVFQNCDFSNVRWSDCYFDHCSFFQCKGTGAQMVYGAFRHVLWEDSVFPLANFDHGKWDTVFMARCDFSEAYFTQCRWKSMILDETNFNGCAFFQTMLKGVDFTHCSILSISLSLELTELKGAVVTAVQAVEFAKLFGLDISYGDGQ